MIQIKFRIKSNFISVKWDSVMKNQACLNDTSCYDTMVCSNNVCDCDVSNNYVWTNYSCGKRFSLIFNLLKLVEYYFVVKSSHPKLTIIIPILFK
jgi:hypothetical protein